MAMRSRTMSLMDTPHYLCSQLVELTIDGRGQWVNLEEIREDGAILEAEQELAKGAAARISAGTVVFEGRITDVRKEEFGWRIEIAFSPDTPWSPERWKPEHLLDPRTLKPT